MSETKLGMKVTNIININTYGGAENLLTTLLPSLQAEGIEVSCIMLCPANRSEAAKAIRDILEEKGIIVFFKEYASLRSLGNFTWIKSKIKESGANLVHCHLRYADIWVAALKFLKQIRIPFVTTVHGYNDNYMNQHGLEVNDKTRSSLYFKITKWVTKKADGLIFISVCMKEFYERADIIGNKMNSVIYHGYSNNSIATSTIPELIEASAPKLVLAGRIVKRKGHAYALETLVMLKQQFKGTTLHVLGKGPFEAEFREMVSKKGMSDAVVFHGYKDDIVLELKKYDIALLPSYWEPFGVVFLDAFAAGIPIVGFDLPAGNEIVTHKYSGLLAEPYNAESLSTNVSLLLSDYQLRNQIVLNGRKELKEKFSLERMAREYLQFYKSILETSADA